MRLSIALKPRHQLGHRIPILLVASDALSQQKRIAIVAAHPRAVNLQAMATLLDATLRRCDDAREGSMRRLEYEEHRAIGGLLKERLEEFKARCLEASAFSATT